MTRRCSAAAVAITLAVIAASSSPGAYAFTSSPAKSHLTRGGGTGNDISTSSLHAMNKRNKFNKQKDLAAKMAEAKRLR